MQAQVQDNIRKMVNRKKIATYDKELAHRLSVNTSQDYVSEMRFKKCILDAKAKINRNGSDSAKQELDRWTNLQLAWNFL